MINGVMGKILWVDLSQGTWREEQVPESVYENFLSGIGLAAYYLYQRIPAQADPLGPENVLAFVSGALTGTGSLVTGRWMAAAKSPLTGTWGDANVGGNLSPAIKQCGYDGIFLSGISPKPVFLFISPGKIELRSAVELWGKDTQQTEDLLKSLIPGKKLSIACIGMAGEKLSLISGISNDGGRMGARSGLGAVMGSKHLKAVVLQGSKRITVANKTEIKRLSRQFAKVAAFQPPFLNGIGSRVLGIVVRVLPVQIRMDGILYKFFLRKYGTSGLNLYSIESGDAPLKNWAGTQRDFSRGKSKPFDPDRIRERETVKYHCYSCPIGCGGFAHYNKGKNLTHKPEYESFIALGGLLMNKDLESVFAANEMLNRAGMDSISAGGTVAFAIECFENGLLTKEETQGLDLRWGDSKSVLKLLEMMIQREGIGDVLADGSRLASQRIGRTADKFAVHAGGQELAMHDGRYDPGYALHAVVEPTPGRHTIGSYQYYEMFQLWRKVRGAPEVTAFLYPKKEKFTSSYDKAAWAAACSQFTALLNSAGCCIFAAFMGVHRYPVFEWLNAAIGWYRTPEEYLQIGWNIQTLRQAFNQREGIPLKHAIHSRPVGDPPAPTGANRNARVPLDSLVTRYWEEMSWDKNSGKVPNAFISRFSVPVSTEEA